MGQEVNESLIVGTILAARTQLNRLKKKMGASSDWISCSKKYERFGCYLHLTSKLRVM